jgi:hypothetical protein
MLQLDTLLLSMTSEVAKRASRVERGGCVQRVSFGGSGKRRKEVQTSAKRIPAPPVILMVFFLDKGRGGMLGRAVYSQDLFCAGVRWAMWLTFTSVLRNKDTLRRERSGSRSRLLRSTYTPSKGVFTL